MNFRPLSNNVLIDREESVEKSPGGILIPKNTQEESTTGKVIATGPGRVLDNGRLVEPSVKKNDIVMFSGHASREITVDGKKLVLVSEDSILGVLDK